MTTFATVIQAAIPGADEALCDHVLCGRTPFPAGPVSAQMLYKAASTFGRAIKNNIRLCDWCDNPVQSGKDTCSRCADIFARMRNSHE